MAGLAELQRVLKPGGRLIVTFSNRYFPPKVIHLWKNLYPTERLGWVTQCLLMRDSMTVKYSWNAG
ncbi:MAG TPA: hypothetical protein DCQ77_07565 [Betaproteobacteria bacterium]|nr:hypothetical protein [Betaproteobacteria bacterium]